MLFGLIKNHVVLYLVIFQKELIKLNHLSYRAQPRYLITLKEMSQHNYYVYITTNPNKTVLYTGVTNDLKRRLFEHQENKVKRKTFAGKFYCYQLIYFEHFTNIEHAIAREKQIKNWSRKKKLYIISLKNPNWNFLNKEIYTS